MSAALIDAAGPARADQEGFLRGIQAAVAMMEGMCGGAEMDCHTIRAIARPGQTFENSVRHALAGVLMRGSAAELEGFCAALTELVADANATGDWERYFAAYARQRARALRAVDQRRARG
jgi:hypothetical protein